MQKAYDIEKKKFSLIKTLNEIVEQTKVYARRIKKELTLYYEDDIVIKGDELKLKRAIGNLISNGLKYCNRSVNVSVKKTDKIEICITDDGKGISKEIKERILSKEMTTTDLINGNGFGLTNAKKIIELHGGNIALDSTDRGTTFRIILPISVRF
jgi:signal transduction histidine kinase